MIVDSDRLTFSKSTHSNVDVSEGMKILNMASQFLSYGQTSMNSRKRFLKRQIKINQMKKISLRPNAK